MYKYVFLLIISVTIASTSQILLKKSANINYATKIKEYLNIYVIVAYSLLLLSTILTMLAYRGLQLSQGMVLEAISYILIPIGSYFIFKEKFTLKKTSGILLIIIGIIIFSLLG